jgi:predicted nucleic acid-binding protein
VRHVFVETNWVVDFAAPSPFRQPDALELLERARKGELQLHLPSICVAEAQSPLSRRYAARATGDAVRQFLKWASVGKAISPSDERAVREALDQFEGRISSERYSLADRLAALRQEPNLEIFALNDAMLERAIDLSLQELNLGPFDSSILAAILARSGDLVQKGESNLAFCELDKDLQPWDKDGNPKHPLTGLYDSVHVWVYSDFALQHPVKPAEWPRK